MKGRDLADGRGTNLTLTRPQAAELCGLTLSGYDSWVRRGIVPPPIPGTRRYSRIQLERSIAGQTWVPRDSQDGLPTEEDAWQEYERNQEARDRHKPLFDLNERERNALRKLCKMGSSNGRDIAGASERTFAALASKGLAEWHNAMWYPTAEGGAENSRFDIWINWHHR